MDMGALNHECRIFTYYLINQLPNSYVVEKYREAHSRSRIVRELEASRFDILLLRLAARGGFLTKLVDSYTRIVRPASVIRTKWVVLLGILETCAPSHLHFESPDTISRLGLYLRIVQRGVTFLASACLSLAVLGPVDVLFVIGSRLIPEE